MADSVLHVDATKARPYGVLEGTYKRYRKRVPVFAKQIDQPFEVDSLEGTIRGNAGDWLAIGIKGELWIIADHIFKITYEEDSMPHIADVKGVKP